MMRLEARAQTSNRIVRSRRHVPERSPMIRDHRSRAQALEQHQCVFMRQMPFPKAGFPPRRVTNGQECKIELSAVAPQCSFDQGVRVGYERSVTSEEQRLAGV